jgi:hypothetical protein
LIGVCRSTFTLSTRLAALGYGPAIGFGGVLVLDADVVFP